MTKTIIQRMLLIMCVGLLHMPFSFGQSSRPRPDEPPVPPIELSQITLTYAVPDAAGGLVWETPKPETPNTIPAGTHKLRFTAKVNNRPKGASIRLNMMLQEICPSPDADKKFISELRYMAESDATGAETKDPLDDEVQVVKPDGSISIEISVHCDDCVRSTCNKECPGRDHLGEGPHEVRLRATDITLTKTKGSPMKSAGIAKPATFKIDIMSICPKEERKVPAGVKN